MCDESHGLNDVFISSRELLAYQATTSSIRSTFQRRAVWLLYTGSYLNPCNQSIIVMKGPRLTSVWSDWAALASFWTAAESSAATTTSEKSEWWNADPNRSDTNWERTRRVGEDRTSSAWRWRCSVVLWWTRRHVPVWMLPVSVRWAPVGKGQKVGWEVSCQSTAGHRPAGEKIYVHLVPLKTTKSL